jgi:ceramide glucosyltransferase
LGVLKFAAIAAVLAACGIGYCVLCLWSAWRFLQDRHQRLDPPKFFPPVTILKPLRGTDPGMYEAFRSHCLQDYPLYELIFGVANAEDPAVSLVERLKQEFPDKAIRLLVCPLRLGASGKVGSLVQMLPRARYEHLIVNDGDIRVPPDYLRSVISPLADSQIGLVTALYRGVAEGTLGSRLEALSIATEFFPNVLVARALEGIHFGLGSTLAFPRRALDAIGGFEPLLDCLADDYELGTRISAAGYRVVLSPTVVDTHLPAYGFREFWQHQLRWARTIRNVRKGGYFGLLFTFSLPWAMLAAVLAPGARWSLLLLALAVLFRLSVAITVGRNILHKPRILRDLWLLPLRDTLGLLLWAGSFAGRSITWRGERFVLRHGKLTRRQ